MTEGSQQQSEHDPLIGAVLSDRYRVLERVSQGGMGFVYRARHVVLESDVAVKVLRRAAGKEDRRRFLQEAKLASAVKHPHIVQVSDFGVLPDGSPFLVMELVSGQTLTEILRHSTIDPLRACRLGVQIAQALATIHEQRIIHRDMKPDNVFVLKGPDGSDFVKIVDFGIVKAVLPEPENVDVNSPTIPAPVVPRPGMVPPAEPSLTPLATHVGQILGTPLYMSPEQCESADVDARSDQYSLGCMRRPACFSNSDRAPDRSAQEVRTSQRSVGRVASLNRSVHSRSALCRSPNRGRVSAIRCSIRRRSIRRRSSACARRFAGAKPEDRAT